MEVDEIKHEEKAHSNYKIIPKDIQNVMGEFKILLG